MMHLLDNPAWNALISGNKDLAIGDDNARCFLRDVSPFVGIAEPTTASFERLYEIIPSDGYFAFCSPVELSIPAPWKSPRMVTVQQMVYEGPGTKKVDSNGKIEPLDDSHIPAMLALTKMTNPGPFFSRTIDFGHYRGIFEGDQLIAMAGQRMHPGSYAEISAVCTHPDHLGKGYAASLLLNQVERIKANGETPFLHVLTENDRAIKLYQALGFAIRQVLNIYTLKKGN